MSGDLIRHPLSSPLGIQKCGTLDGFYLRLQPCVSFKSVAGRAGRLHRGPSHRPGDTSLERAHCDWRGLSPVVGPSESAGCAWRDVAPLPFLVHF